MSRARTNANHGDGITNADLAENITGNSLDVGLMRGRRNLIINGAIQVSQRGTSDTSFTYGYAVDRFYLDQFGETGATHTYQQLSASPPTGFRNYLRWQRNSGETATGAMRIYYTGETGASQGIAGNKLTLSFYARVGSDYSGGSLESRIVTGEGTDETRSTWANGNWTNQVNDSQSNTLTTSWQRFTHTLGTACGDDVSQHGLRFVWTPTGTASTNDYIEITGIQLEVGEVATPYEHRTLGEEQIACQRYYEIGRHYSYRSSASVGSYNPDLVIKQNFQTPKRNAPTITTSNLSYTLGATSFDAGSYQDDIYGFSVAYDVSSVGAGGVSVDWQAYSEF
jgi:hypothetical protein